MTRSRRLDVRNCSFSGEGVPVVNRIHPQLRATPS